MRDQHVTCASLTLGRKSLGNTEWTEGPMRCTWLCFKFLLAMVEEAQCHPRMPRFQGQMDIVQPSTEGAESPRES